MRVFAWKNAHAKHVHSNDNDDDDVVGVDFWDWDKEMILQHNKRTRENGRASQQTNEQVNE